MSFSDALMPKQTLDLRTTKCPLNFVQTRLALEKLAPGEILAVIILKEGESAINIPQSIVQEGHEIVLTRDGESGSQVLLIRKQGVSC